VAATILEQALRSPILIRLSQQLKDKGISGTEAAGMALAQLQKFGILDSQGRLTDYGQQRQELGAAGRAQARSAKYSGGKHGPGDYAYSAATNRATLAPRK
jgi:hypothetical protein